MLPEHGKIDCRLCYEGGDNEAAPHPLWRMRNDPGAWGGRDPEWLVLGFSKGSTQADYYADGSFNEVAFAGMRSRLERILKHVGALASEETLNAAISNPDGNVAFGSLIRCSVSRQDKSGQYQCSGPLIKRSFKEIPEVISSCANQFLKPLPDNLKTVVMLGNDSGYVKLCQALVCDLYPDTFEVVNEVAVQAGGRLWIHVAHPSRANGHFEGWMAGQAEASRKRKLVEEALGLYSDLPQADNADFSRNDEQLSPVARPISTDDIPTYGGEELPEIIASHPDEIKITSRVKRGKKAGALLVPHLYKDGCYVVSMTRFEQDQIRVETIEEALSYIQKGYKLRMSDPDNPSGPSLISSTSIDVF